MPATPRRRELDEDSKEAVRRLIRAEVSSLESRIDDLESRLDDLENQVHWLESRLDVLEFGGRH